jgi:endonuclease YncB( thermonuclease family)
MGVNTLQCCLLGTITILSQSFAKKTATPRMNSAKAASCIARAPFASALQALKLTGNLQPRQAQAPCGQKSRQYQQQRLPIAREINLNVATIDRYGLSVAEVISGISSYACASLP